MNKKIMFIFFGIILSSSFCFAAETVTITTYYPAPYGVYNVLKLFPIAAPAICTEGELYFNSTSHNLFYCNNTPAWQSLGGGFWTASGNDIQNTNTGLVAILTNLRLPASTAAVGVVYRGADRFLHSFGTNNTFLGTRAGNLTMTGGNNTGVGVSALAAITTGTYNTAVGEETLSALTTGGQNTAVGEWSLYLNTSGSYNATLGAEAGRFNVSGSNNVFAGYQSGYSTTAGNNVFVGYQAGNANTTGSGNVYLGHQAGYTTVGSNNILIGYQAGYNLSGSNQLYIENSNIATPLIYGDFTNNRVGINRVATTLALEVGGEASKATAGAFVVNSDRSIKTDVKDLENALAVIDKLRPVKFRYTEEYLKKYPYIKNHYYYNFIAQEFQKVFPESVEKNAEGYLQMDSYPVTPYLVAAVQQLNKKVDELKEENKELKRKIEGLK